MAKFPIKSAINFAKKAVPIVKEYGPKVMPYIPKDAPVKAIDSIKSYKVNKKESKKLEGKVPYRKIKFKQYHSEVLPNLWKFNLLQLKSFINEVKSFITQIEAEGSKNIINEKIKDNRITNWKEILIQLEDVVSNKSYQEFLKMYHSKEYVSTFFEEKMVMDFKSITDKEEMYNFIKKFSKKTNAEFVEDFY